MMRSISFEFFSLNFLASKPFLSSFSFSDKAAKLITLVPVLYCIIRIRLAYFRLNFV